MKAEGCGAGRTAAELLGAVVKVAVRDGIIGALGIPEDLEDVPAIVAVQQLEGLDAASHGFRVFRMDARLVGGVDVGHETEAFDLIGGIAIEEAFLRGVGVRVSGVLLRRKKENVGGMGAAGCEADSDAAAWDKERPKPGLVELTASRRGDGVVEGVNDALDGGAIGRRRGWPIGVRA